ncbi:MAG: HAMP domain-containing histidine kinase [Oscillospiraceae bacterium]|nr:HAMP domain-containing histidine kinase [Oscillospiraceae bacterium]
MKKLLENRGLRVLAFALCLAFAVVAFGCSVAFVYLYFDEDMTGERDFFNSGLAATFVNQNVWNALHTVYYEQTGNAESVYSVELEPTPMPLPESGYDNAIDPLPTPHPASSGNAYPLYPIAPTEEGFACVIRNADGTVMMDTRTESSVPVPANENSFWELNGHTADCYVNLPAPQGSSLYNAVTLYDFLYNWQHAFLPLAIVCGLLAVALFVFLMAAAGRTAEGVRLSGLHRLPLEIYAGALVLAGVFFAWAFVQCADGIHLHMLFWGMAGMTGCLALSGAAALLLCMTMAARFRAGQWWRNTVTFFVLRLCWRVIRWFFRTVKRVILAIPVAWKAGLVFAAVALVNVIGMIIAVESRNGEFWLLVLFLLDAAGLAAALLIGVQLKKLRAAGRALAAGNLTYAVDTSKMWGDLKAHAEDLNAVSLGMSRAVNERMKSERFKTELITNVSHDLKTPLTSIVNYVDLLKKEEIDNEKAREYIDVLDRQSQRLRKLTTDLVDASKASSGALPVSPERLDLKELLSQSVGEYAERFALAEVKPVLSLPEEKCVITADGRLLWRVLDNLFQNVTKYAQPGTRFYIDAVNTPGGTELALKNISRQALNIPAEELLERFVRGDASRSTEGSGLGLSIARSLMELMGGGLRLALDGDLFKVTLVFPGQGDEK